MPRRALKPLSSGENHFEIPELELECLKMLWEAGDLTVHGVRQRLYARRPLAYTTVMTVLDRLARKGAVSRRKVGRAYLYHSEYSQEAARDHALNRLVGHYFGGSREQLLTHLLGERGERTPSAGPSRAGLDEALL